MSKRVPSFVTSVLPNGQLRTVGSREELPKEIVSSPHQIPPLGLTPVYDYCNRHFATEDPYEVRRTSSTDRPAFMTVPTATSSGVLLNKNEATADHTTYAGNTMNHNTYADHTTYTQKSYVDKTYVDNGSYADNRSYLTVSPSVAVKPSPLNPNGNESPTVRVPIIGRPEEYQFAVSTSRPPPESLERQPELQVPELPIGYYPSGSLYGSQQAQYPLGSQPSMNGVQQISNNGLHQTTVQQTSVQQQPSYSRTPNEDSPLLYFVNLGNPVYRLDPGKFTLVSGRERQDLTERALHSPTAVPASPSWASPSHSPRLNSPQSRQASYRPVADPVPTAFPLEETPIETAKPHETTSRLTPIAETTYLIDPCTHQTVTHSTTQLGRPMNVALPIVKTTRDDSTQECYSVDADVIYDESEMPFEVQSIRLKRNGQVGCC